MNSISCKLILVIACMFFVPQYEAISEITSGKINGAVNLRAGPGTKFKILKVLKKNTKVNIVSKERTNWIYLTVDETYGYVSKKYVTEDQKNIEFLNKEGTLLFNSMVPIVLILISFYANRLRRVSENDDERINDWAVSTDILIITFGIMLVDLSNSSTSLVNKSELFWFCIVFLLIFLSVDYDKNHSWIRDSQNRQTKKKRKIVGIVLPDFVSVLVYFSYQFTSNIRYIL